METFSVTAGKFECPKDFTEAINTEGLCVEDIADDNELFIIQAPAEVDFKKLHDQQLHLRGPTTFYYPKEDGHQETYMCTTVGAEDNELAKGCLVLPERDSLKLCVAEKHIEGIIYIEKRPPLPQLRCPEMFHGRFEGSENVQKRAGLPSSGGSTVLSDNYGKKGTPKNTEEDLSVVNGLSSQSVTKKKKKKRHLTQDEDPSEDIPTKSQTENKQNKRDHVMHVKAEALSDVDYSSGGSRCKDKASADPQQFNSQISHSHINSKNFASVKKKKKHRSYETSHEIEEYELSEKISASESRENSPCKPHKKKHKTLDSSVTDPYFAGDSQEHRKHGKTTYKADKSKKSSSHGDHISSSINAYFSNYKIKEETEDHTVYASSSCIEQLSEVSSRELATTSEKKSKKKEKKEVNSDDQSSGAYISKNEINELEDHTADASSSYTEQRGEISNGELATTSEKKSKKKKKVNSDDQVSGACMSNNEVKKENNTDSTFEGNHSFAVQSSDKADRELFSSAEKKLKKKKKKEDKCDNQSSSADLSNYEIKKETEDNHHTVESRTHIDCLNGELSSGQKKKSKKKKKDKVPDEDFS